MSSDPSTRAPAKGPDDPGASGSIPGPLAPRSSGRAHPFVDAVTQARCTGVELTLRPYTDADAPRLASLIGNEAVAAWTGSVPSPYPVELALGWLWLVRISARRGASLHFAVDAPGEGLVGSVGFFRRGAATSWELGYWFGQPYWGRGYATACAHAALAWMDAHLAPPLITASYHVDNVGSRRVLETNGFVSAGAPFDAYCLSRNARLACAPMHRIRPEGQGDRS